MKAKYFDTEKTLEQIAQIFAKHGYEGTSLEVITKETGIGKQSLYNAYGDKKSMIEKAMGCFGKENPSVKTLCNDKLSGREKINAYFEATFTECKGGGCLITNQILEKGATDKELLKIASKRWEQTRATFQKVIEEGIQDKSIKSKVDPEILSYSIMNLLNGLRVTARATSDTNKIKEMVKVSLRGILD